MRIAVSSQNFRTVTGHAGRARRFIIFEADGRETPREVGRLDLEANMAIHGYDHGAVHPLDRMNVLITGGAGEGFIRHLGARGVRVVSTEESVPELAVAAFLEGRVRSASEGCSHEHSDIVEEELAHGRKKGHTCNCSG
ncbi:MAG: NifB/NifX family molybdenum-iron cluster-binding protein [Gallionella sp.]